MSTLHRKHAGTANELEATTFLLRKGHDVFRNVSPHGLSDLVAVNYETNEKLLIDVKSTVQSRLSKEQIDLGIKLLVKVDDEWIFIDNPPKGSTLVNNYGTVKKLKVHMWCNTCDTNKADCYCS